MLAWHAMMNRWKKKRKEKKKIDSSCAELNYRRFFVSFGAHCTLHTFHSCFIIKFKWINHFPLLWVDAEQIAPSDRTKKNNSHCIAIVHIPTIYCKLQLPWLLVYVTIKSIQPQIFAYNFRCCFSLALHPPPAGTLFACNANKFRAARRRKKKRLWLLWQSLKLFAWNEYTRNFGRE